MTARGRLVDMAGRDPEREIVSRVLDSAAAGPSAVLLIGGDAGVGKTTLARYAAEQARVEGFRVLEGACLDIAASVPFGPVVEALRPVLRELGERSAEPGWGGDAVAVAGALSARDGPVRISPGHALGALREVMERLATVAPVLLVLEDMHWAGQSTRDLAVSLARTASGPVVLLLTFRADDLHRRHPFRSVLGDITRSARCERIDLAPLDRAGLTALIVARTGRAPDPAFVGLLLARSEGNPLFAEELLAAGATDPGLPVRLADLLLARVDALPDRSRRVVRTASVAGSRIDPDLLVPVTEMSGEEVEAGLREAVDANVLAQRGGRLEFRHGLLRDAAYEDLLPGERTRLHEGFARAIQFRVGAEARAATMAEAGELAFHWYAAADLPRAFAASVRAGQLAEEYGAAEAIVHLVRALELWDRVPDPVGSAGMARADVVRLAAESTGLANDHERGLALIDEAIDQLGPDADPLLASRLHATRATVCAVLWDGEGSRVSAERAVALAEGTESVELAHALTVLGVALFDEGRCAAALEVGGRAAQMARTVGSDVDEAIAKLWIGDSLLYLGQVEAGLAEIRASIDLRERAGRFADAMIGRAELANALFEAGRPEEAIAAAREGVTAARQAGLPATVEWCAEQEVEVLTWMGDWEPADLLLRELIERGYRRNRARGTEGMLAAFRGDFDAAATALREEREWLSRPGGPYRGAGWYHPALWGVDLLLARGEIDQALELSDELVTPMAEVDADLQLATVARAALASLVAARESRLPVPERLAGAAADLLSRTAAAADAGGCGRGTLAGAQYATARAWSRRLASDPAPEAWRVALDAWRATGYGYPALLAEVRLAEALIASGDRDTARGVVLDAWIHARDMGAKAVIDQIAALARRARFPLDGARTAASGPLDALTPREREVLDLIAAGASNRTIAATLFISEKTVSVHVSNLMAKLDGSHRFSGHLV